MESIGCGPFVDAISRLLWKNKLLQGQDIVNMAHYNMDLEPKSLVLGKFRSLQKNRRAFEVICIKKYI